jgi:hypothetical protein
MEVTTYLWIAHTVTTLVDGMMVTACRREIHASGVVDAL